MNEPYGAFLTECQKKPKYTMADQNKDKQYNKAMRA